MSSFFTYFISGKAAKEFPVKKSVIFSVMLVVLLALGLALVSCDNDDGNSTPNEVVQAGDPLVLTGKSGGKTVTVTISQTDPAKAVLTVKGGEFYEIRLASDVISRGKISINGNTWLFVPSSDSPGTKNSFPATYSNDTLFFSSIPGAGISDLTVSVGGGTTTTTTSNNDDDDDDEPLPVLTGTVTIDNKSPKVGDTLAATYAGNGSGKATWQWLRDDTVISGTNSNAYIVAVADEGQTLKARVNYAGQSGSVTSAATGAVVAAATPTPTFVAVSNITGCPSTGTAGTPLTLTGTVNPAGATNKTITWSVQSAGGTGASISGNTLHTATAGTVKVRATITNGLTATTSYTQDFDIVIGSLNMLDVNIHRADSPSDGSAFVFTVDPITGADSYKAFNGLTDYATSSTTTVTVPASVGLSNLNDRELKPFNVKALDAVAVEVSDSTSLLGMLKTDRMNAVLDWLNFLDKTLDCFMDVDIPAYPWYSSDHTAIKGQLGGIVDDTSADSAVTTLGESTLNSITDVMIDRYDDIMDYLAHSTDPLAFSYITDIKDDIVRVWFNETITDSGIDFKLNDLIYDKFFDVYPQVKSIN